MSISQQDALVIRPAAPAEAEFLSALALCSKAHWGYSPDFLDACREELSYTAEQIESAGSQFSVADLAGVVVGFYALNRVSTTEFELEALFVEPEHIGEGIGRALIEHATCAAAGVGGKLLMIHGDPHAERFYTAAGGRLLGRRESDSIPGRYLPMFAISLERIDVA